MIKQYRMWLLRQQRRRAQRRSEEVCASLSVRLIDGSLYIVNGGTLIHKFSTDNSVGEVITLRGSSDSRAAARNSGTHDDNQ